MSPAQFKAQVAQLASELARCIELCEEIRANRRLGSTQENLDRLQSSFESGEMSLPTTYNDIRKQTGSRMDMGDDKARTEMNQHILSIQSTLKPRLKEIAYPARPRPKHEKEQSGFVDLHRQWKVIHRDASETILSLGRRITTTAIPAPPSAPTPPSPLQSKAKPASASAEKTRPKKTDEVTISLSEFHQMLAHMQNSWEEVIVGGKILYVNSLDKEKKTWDMPPAGAFVKTCARMTPKSEKRKTVSWDTTSLNSRAERTPSWDRPYMRSFKIPEWEQKGW